MDVNGGASILIFQDFSICSAGNWDVVFLCSRTTAMPVFLPVFFLHLFFFVFSVGGGPGAAPGSVLPRYVVAGGAGERRSGETKVTKDTNTN